MYFSFSWGSIIMLRCARYWCHLERVFRPVVVLAYNICIRLLACNCSDWEPSFAQWLITIKNIMKYFLVRGTVHLTNLRLLLEKGQELQSTQLPLPTCCQIEYCLGWAWSSFLTWQWLSTWQWDASFGPGWWAYQELSTSRLERLSPVPYL